MKNCNAINLDQDYFKEQIRLPAILTSFVGQTFLKFHIAEQILQVLYYCV